MDDALKFLFESEVADRILKFLRTRGEKARIIAPAWVWQRVTSNIPPGQPSPLASWAEDIGTPDPNADGFWNYVTIAENVERERAIAARVAVRGQLKIHGLFSHVLPALLCNVNGFARGRGVKELKRYALVCVPRSGSRFFASMLDRRGLGAPLEHLREPLAAAITKGGLGFGPAVEALERFGQRNSIFGTKLISSFLINASRKNLHELETNVRWMISRGYRFFYIVRPLNEMVISSYIATRLEQWHFFGQVDDAARNKLNELVFARGAVWDEYIRFRAQKAIIDHIAQKFGFTSISYCDVQSKVDTAVDCVCKQMEIDPRNLGPGKASIPTTIREQSRTYQTFTMSLEQMLEERNPKIMPGTVQQLQILAGIEPSVAAQIATGSTDAVNIS